MSQSVQPNTRSLGRRLWVYQSERFPLTTNALLVFVLAVAGTSFAAGQMASEWPDLSSILIAFFVALGFFFQLRVADEFKDYVDDAAYRPYRPVPRGVISLRELALLAASVGIAQLLISLWLAPVLIVFLLVVWAYMALMGMEFFVAEWLKRQHALYLLSHMVILPLIFLYITACVWAIGPWRGLPGGLVWFLVLGYANGIVYEIGRKVRSPADEETGVDTYTKVWGNRIALLAWWGSMATAAWCAVAAAGGGAARPVLIAIVAAGLILTGMVAGAFVRQPSSRGAAWVERSSALWLLVVYTTVGVLPIVLV